MPVDSKQSPEYTNNDSAILVNVPDSSEQKVVETNAKKTLNKETPPQEESLKETKG